MKQMGRWRLWILVLMVAAFIPRAGMTQAFSLEGANCKGLKLKEASGVPDGAVHTYKFVGTCWDGTSKNFPAEASVTWDGKARRLTENFTIIGTFINGAGKSYSGTVSSVMRCNDDPLITKGVCNPESHNNETGAVFLSNPYKEGPRPITQGKTTLAEATALSKVPSQRLRGIR
jgi:hypothetical protein